MTLQEFISGSVGAWAVKAVSSLGMGVISYVGFGALESNIELSITTHLDSLPAVAYQLVAMAGFVDAIGIWFSALTAAVTFLSLKKLAILS